MEKLSTYPHAFMKSITLAMTCSIGLAAGTLSTLASDALPVPYDPLLWLDASDLHTLTLDGDAVTKWSDKSGNGNDATQGMANLQPMLVSDAINGKPALDFDSHALTFPDLDLKGKTVLAVVLPDNLDNAMQVISNSTDNVQLRIQSTGAIAVAAANPIYANGNPSAAAISAGSASIVGFILNSQMEYSVNGTFEQSGINDDGSGDTTYNQIGARQNMSEALDGKIAEILVVNSVSANDRQRLEGYLAHKWGLTANLPAEHPFKATAPKPAHLLEILKVDFGQNSPDPLQDGYQSFYPWEPGDSVDSEDAHFEFYDNSYGTAGSISVSVEGQTHWRDYAPVASGPYLEWNALLSDHVLRNADGTLTVTLSDLKADDYILKTYHHNTSSSLGGGIFDVHITDADRTDELVGADLVQPAGSASPNTIMTLSNSFRVDGGDLVFKMTKKGGGSQMNLNGFVIQKIVYSELPVVTLNGESEMRHEIGENFSDPGVTAVDAEDGTLDAGSISLSYMPPWVDPEPIAADTYEGLQLWLKADSEMIPGAWADQSLSGNDATAVGNPGPQLVLNALNGLPVMRYSGNAAEYHSFPQISDVRTVFWVAKRNSGQVFMLGDDNNYHFHSDGNRFWSSQHAHANIRDGRLAVDYQVVDGLNTDIPTKWSIISLRTTGNVEASRFTSDRTYGRQWNGDLAELLIYNEPLSDDQILDIETRLAIKWGLPWTPKREYTDTLDTNILGEWEIKYTATDSHGAQASISRKLDIFNPNAPIITLTGDAEMHHELGNDFTDPGFTVTDKDGGPLDETQAEIFGEVDGHTPGRYIIRYDFIDGDGNEAITVYRIVEVSDTVAPDIVLAGGESIKHPVGQPFIDPGYSATDIIDGSVIVQSSQFLYDRLLHKGFDDSGSGESSLNFVNNGGILNEEPDGERYLTGQLYLDENHTNVNQRFQDVGVGITNKDQFRNVFSGYFFAKLPGEYEFGVARNDERVTLFLDLDRDGLFEDPGEKGSEWMNDGYGVKYNTVSLQPGLYKFAAGHWEGGGGSNIEIRFRTPTGAGPTTLTTVNPSAANQKGLWMVNTPIDTSTPGVKTITYTSVDAAGNVATKTRTVEVINVTEKPVITLLGRSIHEHEQYTEFTDPGFTVADADGNALDASGVSVGGALNIEVGGSYVLVYTFFDANGIPADPKTRIVKVVDTVAPELELVGDAEVTIVEGEKFIDPGVTLLNEPEGGVQTSSNAPIPTENLFLHVDAGRIEGYSPGDVVLNWRDVSGNGNDLDDVRGDPVLVDGSIGGLPAIRVNGNDYLAASGTEVRNVYSVYSVSRLSPNSNGRLLSSRTRNWLLGYYSNKEDLFHPGGWATPTHIPATLDPHIYSATSSGSKIHFYADGVDLATSNGRNDWLGRFQAGGYNVANEPARGDISEVLIYKDHVSTDDEQLHIHTYLASKYGLWGHPQTPAPDLSQPGEHTITYFAQDMTGNVGTITRKVTVTPNPEKPIITLTGEPVLTLEYGADYEDAGATVKDGIGDLDPDQIVLGGSLDTSVLGLHTITYDFTSLEGVKADQVLRTITVVDSTPPEITLQGDEVIRLKVGETFTDPGVTAEDARNGTVAVFHDTYVPHDGMVLHLDANSFTGVVSDGQNIGTWIDQSGNRHHANNRTGDPKWIESGLNSLPVVDFDGNDMVWTSKNFEPDLDHYTILTVARYSASGNQGRVFSTRSLNWFFGFQNSGTERFYSDGWVYNQANTDTEWHLHVGDVNDSDQANFWKDGVQLAFNDPGLSNTNYKPKVFQIAGHDGNREMSKCQVAEVLLYDRVLSSEERDNAVNYLNTKYNLNGGGDFHTRFDFSQAGTHNITYVAHDNLGNKSTATRTLVVIEDDTKPYIVLEGEAIDHVEAGTIAQYVDPGAKALAADGTDLAADLTGQGTVDTNTPGIYTLSYSFTDAESQIRTVIVEDTVGPAITLNGDSPLALFLGQRFEDPGGIGEDILDGTTQVYSNYLPIPDVMDFKQYHLGNSANFLNFENEGGILSENPVWSEHITGGYHGDGIKFLGDMDFRIYTGTGRYDSFQHLASGQFHAKKEGIYEFQTIFNRDYIAAWLDKDQDGKFERFGDEGDERIVWGNTQNTVYLKPGHYRVAFGNSAGQGEAQMHIRFRTPEGAGPTTLTTVHPGGPGQEGLWSTWPQQLDTSVPGQHTIRYFSDDKAGNRSTVTREVFVEEDMEKPVIQLLGAASVFLHAGTPFIEPGYVLEDFEGNPLDSSLVNVSSSPDGRQTGTFTIRYTYTDPDGHTADPKVRIIDVEDILPPVMTVVGPNPYIHPLGEPFVDPGVQAMDAYDGPVYVKSFGAPAEPFALIDIGPNNQRVADGWAGAGLNRNNSQDNANFAFADFTATNGETFQFQISNGDWRDRGDSSSTEALAKVAEDHIKNNGGDLTLHFRNLPAGDYLFTTFHLDPGFDQSHLINIHVTDAHGSDVKQVPTGDASKLVPLNGITDYDLFESSATFPVTANGNSDVVIRIDGQYPDRETPLNGVAINYPVSTPEAGTYDVTYIAIDSHGNRSELTRSIIVQNVSGVPEIALVGDSEMTIDVGSLFEDPGVVLKDKNGADADASLVEVSGVVETEVAGTYRLGYDYTDGEGNAAVTIIRTVHVKDLSSPVITLVGGDTIRHQLGNRYIEPGFSAVDYVDGPVIVDSSEFKANRMRLTGYKGGENDPILNLDGNGGLLQKGYHGVTETFNSSINITNNAYIQDNYFPGLGNNNFQVLFDGRFHTTSGGIYEFGIERVDDRSAFWVDLDGDGVFENNGDRGSELMNPGYQRGYREIRLEPGEHRYAIASRQGGQGYIVQARYRAVSGVGPGSLVDINASSGIQANQWIVRNSIDVLALGEHEITYTSVDAAGNVATAVRTVIVENNPDAAILTLLGDAEMTIPYQGTFTDPGVTIKDLDGNDLPADNLAVTGEVDLENLGKYILEYNYTTAGGIVSRALTRTVYVVDNEAPVITLVGDAEMTVTQGADFVDPGYSATDNYDGDIVLVGSSQNFPQDGLVLHLDASAIKGISEGDPVSLWYDLSPNGHNADVVTGTPVYVEDSINGRPAVRFDGSSRLGTTKSFGGTYTVLSVSRLTGGSNQRLITSRDRNWVLGYIANKQDILHVPSTPDGWVTIGSKPADTEPQLYSASSGDGRVHFYANGKNKSEVPQKNNGTIGFFQMGAWQDGDEPAAGDVAEVLIYNRVLTESERRGIEASLNGKYSLNGVTEANTPVDTTQLGEYTVIYQASDLAGNLATETRKVTVVADPTAPTITLSGDEYVLHEASDTYTDAGAVLKDSSGTTLDSNLLQIEDNVDPLTPGLYTYTYRYEPDGSSPAIPVTRTIEVRDTVPPVVTLEGASVVKLAVGATYTEEGATAFDQANGSVAALDSHQYTFGQLMHNGYQDTGNRGDAYLDLTEGATGLLSMSTVGVSTLPSANWNRGIHFTGDGDFQASVPGIANRDKFQNLIHGVLVAPVTGEYTFEIRETQSGAATIWLDLDQDGIYETNGDNGNERVIAPTNVELKNLNLEQGVYPVAFAYWHWANEAKFRVRFAMGDNVLATVNPAQPTQVPLWASVNEQPFDTSQAGTYTIEYTAYDSSGNKGTATRTIVVVEDTSLPFIALNEGPEITHEIGTPFIDPGAVVTNESEQVLEGNLQGVGTVDANTLGEYVLTYDFTDGTSGKSAVTATRKVIVVDTQEPVVALEPFPATGETDVVTITVGTDWEDPGITLQDGNSEAWFVSSRDYIPGRLAFAGYQLNVADRNRLVSFDLDGNLFEYEPVGQGYFRFGPGGNGYNFNNENDFRSVPSGLTRNDEFQTLLHGYFRAPVAGTYEFKTDYQRNHQAFWLDVDKDERFNQIPDRLNWGNGTSNPTLDPGFYRVALGFYHVDRIATARFLFKTPEGGGVSDDFTYVKPAADAQSTLWYAPGDGPIDTTFPGTHEITYYALDPSGNMSTLRRTLIVEIDPDAPVLTLNGDAEVQHQLGTTYEDAGVTVTDKDDQVVTDPAPTVEVTVDGQIVAGVDGTIAGTYHMVYNFTDGAGKNAIPVSRTVIVADTAPPVITILGDNPVILPPGIEYFAEGATAVDSLDGEVTVTIQSSSPAPGLLEPGLYAGSISGAGMNLVSENPGNLGVDPLGPTVAYTRGAPWTGNITFVYTGEIFDADGAMSFVESIDDALYLKVNDQIVINDGTWNQDKTSTVDFGQGGWFDFELRTYNGGGGAGPVNDPGFGFDAEGGTDYIMPANVDANTMSLFRTRKPQHDSVLSYAEGTQTITYTATDAAGNTATVVREVIIRDDLTLPVIELVGDANMTHEVGEPFVDPGYTLMDRRGNVLSGDATITGNVDHTKLGENVITYEFTDSEGREAGTVRRYITVVDTTPPEITLTGGEYYRISRGQTYVEPGVTVTDNLDTDLEVTSYLKPEGISPVALWDFNESDGNIANEQMNNLDGQLINFPDPKADSWVPGLYGNALQFDSANESYIRIAGSELLDLQQFTISVWVRSDAYNRGMFLFEKTVANTINTQYNLYFEDNDTLVFKTFGNSEHILAPLTTDLTIDEWQHVVATFDGENKNIYLNGEFVGSDVHDTSLPTDPNGPAYIGAFADGEGYHFHGLMDDLKIYAQAFEEAAIPELAKQSGVDTSEERDTPYEVTYTSVDHSGNKSEVTRFIVVSNDTTPPSLGLVGAAEITIEQNSTFEDPGATANDNKDGNISALIVVSGSVDTSKVGVYTLTYSVMDKSFNAATEVTRTVTVGTPTEPTDPLEKWIAEKLGTLSAGDQDPEADPDNDKLNNFGEYALGGNPTESDSSSTIQVNTEGEYLKIQFLRIKNSVDPDITYTAEMTTDLVNDAWSNVNVTITLDADQNGAPDDYEKVTATVNVKMADEPDGKQFLRITASRD